MNNPQVRAAVEDYQTLGLDPIPLKEGSKLPVFKNWQVRESARQWERAPENANVGIRCGDGFAVIDADNKNNPHTFDNVTRWLAGLGYFIEDEDYTVVQTASIVGRQIPAMLEGNLPGDYRRLSPEVGAGEFRYGRGAYVVAPPSQVQGSLYQLVTGDFRQMPRLRVADVLPILSNRDMTPRMESHGPVIPRSAWSLLRGNGVDKFPSRSEAEQSLITILVNAGHSFDSILTLFITNPCAGKFSERYQSNNKDAVSWLKRSYENALEWTNTHESQARKDARQAMEWAENRPWPGRTGRIDRAVFLAHCAIALKAGQPNYAASFRVLAELAGVNHMTAFNATKRLQNSGLLSQYKPGTAELAALYQLTTNLYTSSIPECEEVYKIDADQSQEESGSKRQTYTLPHSMRNEEVYKFDAESEGKKDE